MKRPIDRNNAEKENPQADQPTEYRFSCPIGIEEEINPKQNEK
ncbi:MAG: hypothetical protein ONB13_10875 [candidate division KSB1 bacterium]|nr:hypothetical protein [candidate division KSB1 bacterium]MDZ7334396.1 hypothetical protein [candidate division KSB1 bacterium]MDZ7358169.1 hypothetical protein [candidate division KSB1 bacterium]MDZ7377114.1 hypothetical protein [candidate division KSB1 bacterium]MDZ7398797.1 hypothetical protein [candidate division KSB1 bacterium]